MRHPALRSLLPALAAIAFLQPSFARVGEPKDDLERRLLRPFVGKFIPREKNPDAAKEAEILRQQPFNEARSHFPPGIRERKYWKSAVPNMLSNENGWRIHVFFNDNVSVLEAYQRVGDALNEFEIQNILRANQGASEWRRIDPDSLEAKASAIGCTHQSADGTLRAKVAGDWLMVYSTALDSYVKEQLRLAEENRVRQQEELNKVRQSTAPGSTDGI